MNLVFMCCLIAPFHLHLSIEPMKSINYFIILSTTHFRCEEKNLKLISKNLVSIHLEYKNSANLNVLQNKAIFFGEVFYLWIFAHLAAFYYAFAIFVVISFFSPSSTHIKNQNFKTASPNFGDEMRTTNHIFSNRPKKLLFELTIKNGPTTTT